MDPSAQQIACAIIATLKRAEVPILLKNMKNHQTKVDIDPDTIAEALDLLVEFSYISQDVDGAIQLTELGKSISVLDAYNHMI